MNHGLFGLCGEVVAARVAMLGLEGELPVDAVVCVAAARTDDVRRKQDGAQHFLLFRSCTHTHTHTHTRREGRINQIVKQKNKM